MDMILNALGVLTLGALGWISLEFVGRPVRGFFDLRRQIRTQMLRFEDLAESIIVLEFTSGPSPLREARKALSDLSDELISFGQSEWFAAYFVRRLGFDPIAAGRRLGVVAEELGTVYEDRAANYRAVDRALKFPGARSVKAPPMKP